jgi:serine/threonine protein kinase
MTETASRTGEGDPHFLAPVREGQTVAGKYVIGRTLGVGGMGIVYAARDARLERQVAIKVLLPRLVTSPTATQRFMREARAATRITSEHVVKLLEIDTLPDGTPLLVMEYLEGRDLRAVLREDGPLPPRLAIDYLLQALQAIAEGHTQSIVHRDLKPSNLFLTTRADGTPLIKVLDFGIAKTLDPEPSDTFALTSSEDVRLGSPTYMPPEQLQNPRDVDSRADIWALGVTLHELVSGGPPFQAQSYAELLSRILSAPPESLKSRIVDLALPAGLCDIVAKCLEKNRDSRYSNAAELATALAPFGSDDARLSLHRVTGLTRSPTTPRSSRVPATIVSDSLGTCETTLPVPVDPALGPQDPLTSSGSRRVAGARASRGRVALVLGVAVVAAAAALISRQKVAPPVSQPEAAKTPAPLVADVSALHASLPQPTAIASAPPAASAAIASPTSSHTPVVREPTKQGLAAGIGPANGALGEGLAASSALLPNSKPSARPPPSASARTPSAEPEQNSLGPSPLMEKLIEVRH